MSRRRSPFGRLWGRLRWEGRLLRHEQRSPREALRKYWNTYGGSAALLRSPYFHLAALIGMLCIPWVAKGGDWAGKILSVVPNLLGFSLSGFAILLAIGSDKFQSVLARAGGSERPVLLNISTSFVHFIVVQATALLFAITSEGIWPILKSTLRALSFGHWSTVSAIVCSAGGFIGCTLLAYSITSLFAATFRVYRLVGEFVRLVHFDAQRVADEKHKGRSAGKSRLR